MKTIFRPFTFGILLAAIFAAGSLSVLAQDPCADTAGQTELDTAFRSKYAGNLADRKAAVDAGKRFLEKYGACETTKDFSDYLKSYLPGMEKKIKEDEGAIAKTALYTRFNNGFKAENWDEVYAAGKDVLAQEPDNLDVILVLGSIGYDQSFKKNYKWNDDTLRYAKMAIQKLNEGKTSPKFGIFQYTYNNKDNALGWMNLTVGYIMYYAQNNKKDALQYLYKASQANSDTKTNPVVFETIGRYYLEETGRIAEQVKTKAAAMSDSDTKEVKDQKTAEIKGLVALLNGNAERAIDAYARAYKVTKTDAATKAYRDGLYAKIQNLYTVRFQKSDGIDTYIAGVVGKPMPDPTTAVTPVEDADVKPQASTSVNTAPAPAAPVAEKPAPAASAKTVTPAAKPVAKAPATTVSAKSKPVSRKVVAKKSN